MHTISQETQAIIKEVWNELWRIYKKHIETGNAEETNRQLNNIIDKYRSEPQTIKYFVKNATLAWVPVLLIEVKEDGR